MSLIANVNYVIDQQEEQLQTGIKVEQIGTWLWVSGATKPIKDELKVLGFFWANGKKAWYHKGDSSRRSGRGFYKSMDSLRDHKGSERLR